jgi:hypothetical protein
VGFSTDGKTVRRELSTALGIMPPPEVLKKRHVLSVMLIFKVEFHPAHFPLLFPIGHSTFYHLVRAVCVFHNLIFSDFPDHYYKIADCYL